MDNWLPIIVVIVVALFVIGNFSTLHKNSAMPMRKKGLNDLKETLPRTNKTKQEPANIGQHNTQAKKNSD